MIAQLLCYVQNSIAIAVLSLEEISIETESNWKNK